MMAGSGIESANKGKGYIVQTDAMHRQRAHVSNPLHDKCCSQELAFHTFGTGLNFLFSKSHNHSICIISFIYPLNGMDYDGYQKQINLQQFKS
jgi:hypothetical protein